MSETLSLCNARSSECVEAQWRQFCLGRCYVHGCTTSSCYPINFKSGVRINFLQVACIFVRKSRKETAGSPYKRRVIEGAGNDVGSMQFAKFLPQLVVRRRLVIYGGALVGENFKSLRPANDEYIVCVLFADKVKKCMCLCLCIFVFI